MEMGGHGSMLKDGNGRYFFLYHTYSKDGSVYTGRQGMLSEVVWREDGWPEFKNNDSVAKKNQARTEFDFEDEDLGKTWQWAVGNKPEFELNGRSLILKPQPENL